MQVRIQFTDPTPWEIIEVCAAVYPGECCVPLNLEVDDDYVKFDALEANFTGLSLQQQWLEVYTSATAGNGCQGQPAERRDHGFSNHESFTDEQGFSGASFGPGRLPTQGVVYPQWIIFGGAQYDQLGRKNLIYEKYSTGERIFGIPFASTPSGYYY
ncbi:hypothetical protein MMC28_009593 [Mycoblastus sanguinarius]|nr:hypothetical protein [Mycoblastus sanguinarius]